MSSASVFSDYIVFVDESGDHYMGTVDADYPLFVLTFCIFEKHAYMNQLAPQISFCKFNIFGHDLAVLHEHDIRKRKGSFAHLSKDSREQLLSGLTTVIEQVPFSIVAVVVDKLAYKAQYANTENLYHTAMELGLSKLHDYLSNVQQASFKTCLVCEARGSKEDSELELAFRRICDGENASLRNYPFEIVIANKQTNCAGLQVADLIARPIGLSVLRPTQPNRAVESLQGKQYDVVAIPHKSEKAASSLTALAPTE